MGRSEDVSDDGPPPWQVVESARALHEGANPLGRQVDDVLDARRTEAGVEHTGRLRDASACGDGVRGVENHLDEGPVRDDLGTPVLGPQSCRQDVVRRLLHFLEFELRGTPLHTFHHGPRLVSLLDGRHGIAANVRVDAVEFAVDPVEVFAEIELCTVA